MRILDVQGKRAQLYPAVFARKLAQEQRMGHTFRVDLSGFDIIAAAEAAGPRRYLARRGLEGLT